MSELEAIEKEIKYLKSKICERDETLRHTKSENEQDKKQLIFLMNRSDELKKEKPTREEASSGSSGWPSKFNPFNYLKNNDQVCKSTPPIDRMEQQKRDDEERDRLRRERQKQLQMKNNERLNAVSSASIKRKEEFNRNSEKVVTEHQEALDKKNDQRVREHEEQEAERRRQEEENLRLETEKKERIRKREEEEIALRQQQINQKSADLRARTDLMFQESQHKLEHLNQTSRLESEQRHMEMDEMRATHEEEKEKAFRELQEREEQLKKAHEERLWKFAEMERQSREQLEEIMRRLKLAEWCQSVEANWTNRLKALKSTDRRVFRALDEFTGRLAVAKVKEMNPEFLRKEMQSLESEVSEVKRVMDREVVNLGEMYNFSAKLFVLDIRNSLECISEVCGNLNSYLESHHSSTFGHPEATAIYDKLISFKNDFRRAYSEIPTIPELKRKYSESFPNSSSTRNESASDDGHVIIIVEME